MVNPYIDTATDTYHKIRFVSILDIKGANLLDTAISRAQYTKEVVYNLDCSIDEGIGQLQLQQGLKLVNLLKIFYMCMSLLFVLVYNPVIFCRLWT
jgi:hypothetical protein